MAFQRDFSAPSHCRRTHLARSPQCSTRAINMNDNNLRIPSLLRREIAASTLRTPRPNRFATVTPRDHRRIPFDVDLHRSSQPNGTLERAPRTALRLQAREAEPNEQWDGFWCVEDDRYYTRCTRADGAVEWYTIRDAAPAAVRHARTRVIPFRRRSTAIVFVSRRDQAPVLVGVSRRRAPSPRRGGRS